MSDVIVMVYGKQLVAVEVETATAARDLVEKVADIGHEPITYAIVEVIPAGDLGPGDIADALVNGDDDDVPVSTLFVRQAS